MSLNEIFLKPYDPAGSEPDIYKAWEESGFFNPENLISKGLITDKAQPFTVVLPPPNVTGTLHLGHAFEHAIEDIVIRYQRMRGKRTLWIPGTDHAAIATQTKVEKILEKEGIKGIRRTELGREKFLERVYEYASQSHDTIVKQVRSLGASLDWSREAYTLDTKREKAVRTAFKSMYDDGLIYRGARTVNWDPKGQTTISDDEIVYKEETTSFYYFKYGPFTIGTARPETKFADKYVVMHPDDERYTDYKHGQTIEVEWINGPITATIIKDPVIDMNFATGVMTITPWHSKVDFDLAEKYRLDREQIIDMNARLLPIAGEFAGMKIAEARPKIIEKLKAKGLLVKIEDAYKHSIATAERSGGTIEPQIMTQWFVDVNKRFPVKHSKLSWIKTGQETTLKELMYNAVKSGDITILPGHFEKIYFHWIENLHDWCISRQIWYGHRIPVWYKGKEVYCGLQAPKESGSKETDLSAEDKWIQDEDTLDTWFSSALWTFSTLGWPEQTEDLKIYHPNSFMGPGYEILFFWVARMTLMSTYHLGEIPFKIVYLHGIVRDSKGQKFSKSLGNGVDPLDIAKEYGADALRMSLVVGVSAGSDSKFDLAKVKAYKNFANKIWNATRFVLSNTEDFTPPTIPDTSGASTDEPVSNIKNPANKAYIEEFIASAKDITEDIEQNRMYMAGEKLYHYFWHRFADIIIEATKKDLANGSDPAKRHEAQFVLYFILKNCLKMMHPFMPFVTEKIWQELPKSWRSDRPFLMVEKWPEF